MEQSTIDSVGMCYEKHGSYRRTGIALGVPYTLVRDVIKGKHRHVSLAAENHLRALLGLTALLPTVEIPACKDCGGAHYGDCGGRQVALRPVSQRTYRTIAAMPTSQLAQAIRNRQPVED